MKALLYYANSAKVAVGLTDRGYSVSPATVSRWSNGNGITPLKVRLVEELLADQLGQQEAAAPDWERLMRTVEAIAQQVGAGEDVLTHPPTGKRTTGNRLRLVHGGAGGKRQTRKKMPRLPARA